MQLGRVIGQATATIKHESLVGWRLLIVQPLNNAKQPEADPVVAVDKFGGAVGQMVVVNSDGKGPASSSETRKARCAGTWSGLWTNDLHGSPARRHASRRGADCFALPRTTDTIGEGLAPGKGTFRRL